MAGRYRPESPRAAAPARREPHGAVVDGAEAQSHDVVGVAHAQLPRRPGTGLREVLHGAQHVPGLEVEQRTRGDRRVVVDRHALVVTVAVEIPQQAYDI